MSSCRTVARCVDFVELLGGWELRGLGDRTEKRPAIPHESRKKTHDYPYVPAFSLRNSAAGVGMRDIAASIRLAESGALHREEDECVLRVAGSRLVCHQPLKNAPVNPRFLPFF